MQCETEPRRFRFRHEWNPRELARGATRAWLSSGILTDRVHGEVRRHGGGKCCATAGGVAIGLALHVCQRITLFGVGGLGRGHVEDEATNKETPPVDNMDKAHNMRGERAWIRSLGDAVRTRCI